MAQIGSINNWPLIAVPPTPGERQVDWLMVNVVGSQANPYTGRMQTQNWRAGWWEATVTMPPMPRILAESWISFMAQCQGMGGVFYYGDGLGVNAQGAAIGQGVTAGSFQSGYQLTTKGWNPKQYALFTPGDWIQIGYRLYKVMDAVASDDNGNASFAIWPQIREVPANGTAILTNNAQGLFRMKENSLRYSVSYNKTYSLSFGIREAI
jgi:hypothetical protein